MTIDLERLLSIARGEILQKPVVTGVEALGTPRLTPKKSRITPVTPLTRQKHKLPKQSFLGVANGVKEGVIVPVGASDEPSRSAAELSYVIQKSCCTCGGSHAPFGVNFDWREANKVRWYCSRHYWTVMDS